MVPVLFHHAPSAQKPPKEATPVDRADYRERLKQQRLNVQALGSMERLRKALPRSGTSFFAAMAVIPTRSLSRTCRSIAPTSVASARTLNSITCPKPLRKEASSMDGPAALANLRPPRSNCAPTTPARGND